jgi:hypothetical protein
MTTYDPAVRPPPGGKLAVAKLSRLIADLRDAALSGLHSARRGAERLANVVDEYCVEFEQPLAMATVRIAR